LVKSNPGKKTGTTDFEKTLKELESLVEKMEQGEISLEESLRYFERGIQLTRACQLALKDAEQKVNILLEKSGNAELQSFENNGAD
jgi:exodeoxyribonuclease VII small subunit